MKRFLNSVTEGLGFILISLSVMLPHFLIDFKGGMMNTPDRVYTYIHSHMIDYYFYLALINEGVHGEWLVSNPYDSTPGNPSIMQIFFPLLGRIGSLFGLWTPFIYHAGRYFFAVTSFIAAYVVIRFFFRKTWQRLLTFLFVIIGGTLPIGIHFAQGVITFDNALNIDATGEMFRDVSYPHHLFARTFMILSTYFILRLLKAFSVRDTITLLICITIAGIAHPPSNFLLLTAVFMLIFLQMCRYGVIWLQTKQFSVRKTIKPFYPWFIFYLLSSASVIILVRSQYLLGFPWNQYNIEVTWQLPITFFGLVGFYGLLLPFYSLGIYLAFKKFSLPSLFLVSWFLTPLLFMPFAPLLGISNARLVQLYPYLPMAILATQGLLFLLQNPFSRIPVFASQTVRRGIVVILLCLMLSIRISMLASTFYLWFFIPKQTWSNIYIDKNFFAAVEWFNQQDKKNSSAQPASVLASFYVGNYLPAFAHVHVYNGHFTYSPDRVERERIANTFFEGKMTEAEARNLIKSNHIDYVLTAEDEHWNANKYPTLLKPVFQQGLYVVIYVPI